VDLELGYKRLLRRQRNKRKVEVNSLNENK